MDSQKYKLVLVTETKQFVPTKSYQEKNDFVMEGELAEFGVENENGRIYEKEEYLPHLAYLQKKASAKRLFGELDHPEKFDITLSKVSHLIESITYDQTANKVRGKIRLFNTRVGADARAIVEGGGVLSISSRSAGVVNESTKKVAIKKIFTYDLVADPGFRNAQLKRMNEDLNIVNENINIYEVGEEFINRTTDSEVRNFLNETLSEIQVLNSQNLITEKTTTNLKTKNKVNQVMKNNENKAVTKDQMDGYSKLLVERLKNMNSEVQKVSQKVSQKENIIDKMVDYTDYIVEEFNHQEGKIDKVIEYNKYTSNIMNNLIGYVNYIAQNVSSIKEEKEQLSIDNNNLKEYVNYLSEKLTQVIGHNDHLAESIQKAIDYSNYLGSTQEGGVQYMKYVAEKLDQLIQYSEYLGETQNSGFDYIKYIAEQLDNSIQHGDYLGENVQNLVNYTKYLGKTVDNTTQYAEYIGENALPKITPREKVNESLSDRINNFLSIVDEKQTKVQEERTVTNLFKDGNAIRFQRLNENEKTKVIRAILENKCTDERQAIAIWEDALSTPETLKLRLMLEHIPPSIKPLWVGLSENQKLKIQTLALNWDLSTPAKIKDFWMRQGLEPQVNQLSLIKEKAKDNNFYTKLNENLETRKVESTLGYSMDNAKALLGLNK